MKLRRELIIAAFGIASVVFFSISSFARDTHGVDAKAIEEVRSGKQKVAHSRWWGFDPEDSTAAIQAAINSGAEKVIVDNVGSPWIVEPLNLAGDQELYFEKGAVLQAKRGSFRNRGDSLLKAANKKNVVITGYGATLKMWKKDYVNPPYEKSEWRNGVSICGCSNVRIAGITIVSSGGDGIYLGAGNKGGTNSDVVVKDVVCNDNHRQGISIITAENLLIDSCTFNNTGGTAPEAGIDFEPNYPSERLVNCVVRNCTIENNHGDGILVYLETLNADSARFSIRVENCRTRGNGNGLRFFADNSTDHTVPRGQLEVVDCMFEKSRDYGIQVVSNPPGGAKIIFTRCLIAEAGQYPPIRFTSRKRDFNGPTDVGGVIFVDCVVKSDKEGKPICFDDPSNQLRLTGVVGRITVKRNEETVNYEINQKLLDECKR